MLYHLSACQFRTSCVDPVSYTHLDVYKRQVLGILRNSLAEQEAEEVADLFTKGYFTHDYPLGATKLQAMGLKVSFDMPTEVYKLMELYPQASATVSYTHLDVYKRQRLYSRK